MSKSYQKKYREKCQMNRNKDIEIVRKNIEII